MANQVIKTYCIDTSALVDMKLLYPKDIFPSLWKNFESFIDNGRLISPQQVFEELKKRDDELLEWVTIHKIMFRELDTRQCEKVRDILTRFPKLIDPQKITPDADPFVIALAMCPELYLWGKESRIVISSEKLGGRGARPKIPDVCNAYGITYMSLTEFFRKENWRF